MKNGTFEVFHVDAIPVGTRVFNSWFIDELKKADKGLRLKSRLITQNNCDEGAASIATKFPTIQRFTKSLMMSMAASKKYMSLYTRDITQAYLQSIKSKNARYILYHRRKWVYRRMQCLR